MRKRGARSGVCGGRDTEDSLCSVCFPLHTSTPSPVLLACVCSRHQGSPQVHTAPGPIKRLKRRGPVFPNAGNYLKSQIACPVPNPGYSKTLAVDLDSDGTPEARWRTNRVSRAGERTVFPCSRVPVFPWPCSYVDFYERRRAGCLSRTLIFFDEDPIGLHYLGRSWDLETARWWMRPLSSH